MKAFKMGHIKKKINNPIKILIDAASMENTWYMEVSQKTKNSYHVTQKFHSCIYIQKKQKHYF